MNIKFPYQPDNRGRTASADYEQHIRELVEQVLFTSPGERVNRPDFGSGLLQLVFQPNNSELASTTQYLVQSALQQWLSDLLEVKTLTIDTQNETLTVSVEYSVRKTLKQELVRFTHELT